MMIFRKLLLQAWQSVHLTSDLCRLQSADEAWLSIQSSPGCRRSRRVSRLSVRTEAVGRPERARWRAAGAGSRVMRAAATQT